MREMGGMFDVDSPVMNVLNKIMNLVVLNLCFVVSCLPVITAGAALTALYSVTLKMVRNEESYIFSSYCKAFRDNFRQGTACWLLLMAAGGVLLADFLALKGLEGGTRTVFCVTAVVFLVVYSVLVLYIFPYTARFKDSTLTSMKNAFFIGGANFGYTVTVLLINLAAATLTFFSLEVFLRAVFLWLAIGFSLTAYINSFFLRKVFDKYKV